MEPGPGRYEWQWLDEATEAFSREGLQVVPYTRTATPPAWLILAHPEILPVDADGPRRNLGSRKHYDHANLIYREHSPRTTEGIAECRSEHPATSDTGKHWATAIGSRNGLGRSCF